MGLLTGWNTHTNGVAPDIDFFFSGLRGYVVVLLVMEFAFRPCLLLKDGITVTK